MKTCAITCTSGRHRFLERSVRFFLDQDYEDKVQLIFQNAPSEQRLNSHLKNSGIILINQYLSSKTKKPYETLGGIYTDALKYVPEDTEVIIFFDDDDIFMPNHISEGIKGLVRGGKRAYKPARSFYKEGSKIQLVSNTLEPSIFVKAAHIREFGFRDTTADQHLSWVNALVSMNEIYQDPSGPPTFCYCWGEDGVFKTSGNPKDSNNFNQYKKYSHDEGDHLITPISRAEAETKYYNLINQYAHRAIQLPGRS